MFVLPSQCTLLENFENRFYSSVDILDLNSCFNIVRRPCSIFCVRRTTFVIFTLHVRLQDWTLITLLIQQRQRLFHLRHYHRQCVRDNKCCKAEFDSSLDAAIDHIVRARLHALCMFPTGYCLVGTKNGQLNVQIATGFVSELPLQLNHGYSWWSSCLSCRHGSGSHCHDNQINNLLCHVFITCNMNTTCPDTKDTNMNTTSPDTKDANSSTQLVPTLRMLTAVPTSPGTKDANSSTNC